MDRTSSGHGAGAPAWKGVDALVAYIDYVPAAEIPAEDRVPDDDNILRIHGVHSRTMKQHYELYRELMYGPGPLSRAQREMIAVVVSARNDCFY